MPRGPGYQEDPAHRVDLVAHQAPVAIRFRGERIAESRRAIRVEETGRPPVYYIPREDVHPHRLVPSATRSHCPFKGEARYFTLAHEWLAPDAAWCYERPYDEVRPLAGYLAFDPAVVDVEPSAESSEAYPH